MRTEIFYFLIFAISFFPTIVRSEENGTNIDKPCYDINPSTFDVIGGSRAFLFWGNFENTYQSPRQDTR